MLTAILLTIAAVFVATAIFLHMVLLRLLIACGLLIAWQTRIRRKMVLGTFAVGIALFLIETFLTPDMSSPLMMAVGIMPLFPIGVLLLDHTHLTRVLFLNGHCKAVLRSLMGGCILAVPPAL